jgi:hypothetical protein
MNSPFLLLLKRLPADLKDNQQTGGSHIVTFTPASSPITDFSPIIAQSMDQQQPMIIVFVNYRLNLFAFGNGTPSSGRNLALKDQRLAIDWVVKYIGGFGGDAVSLSFFFPFSSSLSLVSVHSKDI